MKKLYVLFHFLIPSKQICSKLLQQGSFFVTIEKRGNNPILTSKLYILFCFFTPSKWICSKLSEQGLFFQDNLKKHFDEFSCVCKICVKWLFGQINILRCAYMLTFFIMHLFAWDGTCIRMCSHMYTCLGTKILTHYTHKKNMCIHMDVFIHVYIYILAYV